MSLAVVITEDFMEPFPQCPAGFRAEGAGIPFIQRPVEFSRCIRSVRLLRQPTYPEPRPMAMAMGPEGAARRMGRRAVS